ncbi:uncharacterized protein LOC132621986 isoform X2 [Lycium barbarum]|uniref:uncharacterized protein LOC132621986 isoform X2 n=1 Tax=Lycium barbarum TaxID=112863 RepID=UPI00293F0646|nr:uncharacterized protein LOC132621986 isoform X2 [Lycium barbarum]
MKATNFNAFTQFRFLLFNSSKALVIPLNPTRFRFLTISAAAALPSLPETLQEDQTEDQIKEPLSTTTSKQPADLFRQMGCTEDDISKIFQRRPSLQKMDVKNLHSKLKILTDLGLNDMLKTAQTNSWIKGFNVSTRSGDNLEISHLQ